MNIPLYLEFLAWRFACGGGSGILEQNLFIIYRCVEYIALLRVLAIVHMTIVLPMRWLSGNCEFLAEYGFGCADMCECVDLMDKACAKIVKNGKKIMDDDFMFGIFDPIKKRCRHSQSTWSTCLITKPAARLVRSRRRTR